MVCVFSGRLCLLGLWVSLVPETGFYLRASSRLVVSLRLCLCVFVNMAPLSSPSHVLSFRSLVRSRFGSRSRGHGGVYLRTRLWCHARAAAARSLTCSLGSGTRSFTLKPIYPHQPLQTPLRCTTLRAALLVFSSFHPTHHSLGPPPAPPLLRRRPHNKTHFPLHRLS